MCMVFKNLALKSTRFSFSGIFFAFGLRFRISWMALLAITCQIAQNENIVCNYPTLAFKIGILGQNKTEPLLYPKCHWCGKGGSCRSFPVFWMSLWHPPQISVGSIQIKLSMWLIPFPSCQRPLFNGVVQGVEGGVNAGTLEGNAEHAWRKIVLPNDCDGWGTECVLIWASSQAKQPKGAKGKP